VTSFELLLVTIEWESPNKAKSIAPSKKTLEPSAVNGNRFEYDIVLYNKEDALYFQLALKTTATPFLKTNDGSWSQESQLYNIQEDLWIIKGDWKIGQKDIGYHHCPSINTIGKIEIGLSENLKDIQQFVSVDINSNIEDFDFTQLKNDFEGELWNLITSNKSNITSDKVEVRYSDKIYRYPENHSIIEFIKAFDHISKSPKSELTSAIEFRKAEKVIPIAQTYRSIATSGSTKLLPSKAVVEKNDLYENRFVCFMLYSIHLIVSKNTKYSTVQIERLTNEIRNIDQRISILQDPDPKVDPDKIKGEIQAQEEFLEDWKAKWEKNKIEFISEHNTTAQHFTEFVFQVSGIRYFNGKATYWGNCKVDGKDAGWSALIFDVDPEGLFEDGKETTVKFYAAYQKQSITVSGSARNKFIVQALKHGSFEYVGSYQEKIVQRQQANYSILESNNWRQFSILSISDKNKFIQERNNQIQTLSKRIEKIRGQIRKLDEFGKEQTQLEPMLAMRRRSTFFKSVKWRQFNGFEPSMTFIQNSKYRSALRFYKNILKSEGIEIEVFDLYENVTSYGLREMPQVYELWCLITIIKILEEEFHFAHNPRDLSALLKRIDPKKQAIADHVQINFKNKLAGRQVTLHYQKPIASGTRPDFILEIAANNRWINLVLDAKFRNYNYKKSIIYETVSMTKKYGDVRNYIFILHPCKDGQFEDRKIKYTNHGGERVYFDENGVQQIRFPFHHFGFIELKPNLTDTLKKLIAMGFEYLLEPSRSAKRENNSIDPKPENEMFCLNCGGTNMTISSSIRGNNRNYYSCTCNDNECGHKIYIDYCWNCKTKLFKHGSYWDYHLESTWSIFDIRCPCCGMTVADRPQSGTD
jgi:hypothetical protein